MGEERRPKFHRERKERKKGKNDKDGEDLTTSASTSVSLSPSSSNSDLSELPSPASTACLPVSKDLPQQPQPLQSLPSKPDFAVDKEAHKPVQQACVLPGLPLPGMDSLGEWACASSDEEPLGNDLYLPPSQMSFVKWPTLEMPAPIDFASLLNTDFSDTAKPAVDPVHMDMPAPTDFGFLLTGEQPDIPVAQSGERLPENVMPPAKHVEFTPTNGPCPGSVTEPLFEDLSEFLESSEQWADTFVQPAEAASPEDLAFAGTSVEKEVSEQLPTSEAHGSKARNSHTSLTIYAWFALAFASMK